MRLSTKIKLTKFVGYVELGIAVTIWMLSLFAPTSSLFWLGALFVWLLEVVGFVFIMYPEYVTNKILNIQLRGG